MDSVRMGSTMSRVLWISVTGRPCPGVRVVAGGGAAGVPVHAVQPDTAGGLGGDGGKRDGLPAKGAVTVGGVGCLCSRLASGLNASRQTALTAMNTTACTRNEWVNRQQSRLPRCLPQTRRIPC